MTFLFILLSLCMTQAVKASESSQMILATPSGGSVFYKGSTVRSEELATAIRKARSGDTVLVLPGTYEKKILVQKKADISDPITIQGVDGLSIFTCGRQREDQGDPIIKIELSRGLRIQGLRFEKCWPSAIEINESEFITIAEDQFLDAQTPIVIKGRSTRYVLLESNAWSLSNPETQAGTASSLKDFYFAMVHEMLGDLILRHNRFENSFSELIVKKPSLKNIAKDYPLRIVSFESHRKSIVFVLNDIAKIDGTILVSVLGQDGQTIDAQKCQQNKDQIHCNFKTDVPPADAIQKVWFHVARPEQLSGWGVPGNIVNVLSPEKKR